MLVNVDGVFRGLKPKFFDPTLSAHRRVEGSEHSSLSQGVGSQATDTQESVIGPNSDSGHSSLEDIGATGH